MKQEAKINKLLNETKRKIIQNSIDLSTILIEFSNKYNEIWKDMPKNNK